MEIQSLFPVCQYFFYFFLLYFLVKQCTKSGSHRKLPPGPWRLPVVGNLHQLVGLLPYRALDSLARKHGPIMYIKLGQLPTIIISSPRIAKEITKTHDVAFANRVDLMLPRIVLYNSTDIASAQYGEYWRRMQKLVVLEFLNHKKVRSFCGLMEQEVLTLVERLKLSAEAPVNLTEKIISMECRIICRATVGRACKDQESSLIGIIKEAVAIAGVFNIVDIFPSMKFLHFLSSGSRRKLERMHDRIDSILEEIIRQHEACQNGEEKDIVDILLRASANKGLRVPITRDNIKANIFEMFIAGIETSSLVIEWAMSEMIKNPEVLCKAQEQVRQVLHGKKRFSETDIQQLRYLKMVIKESLRLHPPGPLLCPRQCREESRIDGYDIPVNTIVMINVWVIGRDPKIWQEPEKFQPERFWDAESEYNGNDFELIPFGAGRRVCPGIAFGMAGVELCLAHLLYHFDWRIPGGGRPEEFDMSENFGASGGRKNNLCPIAKFKG